MSRKSVNDYRNPSGFDRGQLKITKVFSTTNQKPQVVRVVQTANHAIKPTQNTSDISKKAKQSFKRMEREENELLRCELASLQTKLKSAEDAIENHLLRERDLKDRLTREMQQNIMQGGKFEDLSLGNCRPTQLVEQYQHLYTQGRLDALDELDEHEELSYLSKGEEVKEKILMGLMVASYRVAKDYAEHVRKLVSTLLCLPDSHWNPNPTRKNSSLRVEPHIDNFLLASTLQYDIEPIIQEVKDQLVAALPEMKQIDKMTCLNGFTRECARMAWSLCNQIPPIELEYTCRSYSVALHSRFHRANNKSNMVQMYVWPGLIDSRNKNVLFRGVIVT